VTVKDTRIGEAISKYIYALLYCTSLLDLASLVFLLANLTDDGGERRDA
jgi:hypothetical protein